MPKTMLVSLWLRSPFDQSRGSDTHTRLTSLGEALEETEGIRKAHHPKHGWGKPQVIFVAPEYLFGRPTGNTAPPLFSRILSYTPHPQTTQERHLNETEANKILGKLKRLSGEYPKFLMIPGTIAWYKLFKDLKVPDAAWDRVYQAARRLGNQSDDELADALDSHFPGAPPHAAPTSDQKLDRLLSFEGLQARKKSTLTQAERVRLANAKLCLNTAVVLYGGKAPFVYHKQGDFHEVLENYDAGRATQVAIPGVKDGVFELEGMKFGIEICLDNAVGALRLHHGTPPPPLIHIITSASVAVNFANVVVKPGGYVMNASCNIGDSGLWYRHPGLGWQEQTPFRIIDDVAGYNLWVYEITIA
ncbi:MAG TPA: hypothetical protein VLS90_05160 [Thermodesulfobacteriota bacterium]|nr:hypothetical protein [Thermodesulfobacteriota bacterium]